MKIKLKIWKQNGKNSKGQLVNYDLENVSDDMSFLEMLDVLNEDLEKKGIEPVSFEHDCREGICGSCSMMINGKAHGPKKLTTACQLHMREFKDGETIIIEPWRAKAFPVIKDLVVDRSSFDRIIQAGGYISVNTGTTIDANSIPISKEISDKAMDAAGCIGCGACVAACPNASAMLFTAAKVSHLNTLPQGQPEKDSRVLKMVEVMDQEMFGSCTNYGECQDACPKGISLNFISELNSNFATASIKPSVNKSKKIKTQ